MKKNNTVKYLFILALLSILLSIVIFDQMSFTFLGIGLIIIGCVGLYLINR